VYVRRWRKVKLGILIALSNGTVHLFCQHRHEFAIAQRECYFWAPHLDIKCALKEASKVNDKFF
jgi:hypothetical protein